MISDLATTEKDHDRRARLRDLRTSPAKRMLVAALLRIQMESEGKYNAGPRVSQSRTRPMCIVIDPRKARTLHTNPLKFV